MRYPCQFPPVTSEMDNIMLKRELESSFRTAMQSIQDPSTIPLPFLSIPFNIDGYTKKNFILDADIQPPIALGWGFDVLQVIPRFKFRNFNDDKNVPYGPRGDESLPVRTPSAMPGVAWYHSSQKMWNSKLQKFFGLYLYHHSNGQDGPEIDTSFGLKRVNLYNGNFSENVVSEFIIGGRWRSEYSPHKDTTSRVPTLGKRYFVRKINAKEFFWKLSYEWHPKFISNKVFDSLRIYGRYRLNAKFGLKNIPGFIEVIGDGSKFCSMGTNNLYEKWRLTLDANFILDPVYYRGQDLDALKKIQTHDISKRLNIWASIYYILGRTKYASIFAQAGYFGSDNYNIYFNDNLWHLKAGISFAFFDQPDPYYSRTKL